MAAQEEEKMKKLTALILALAMALALAACGGKSSGSGKTTLPCCLNFLERPDAVSGHRPSAGGAYTAVFVAFLGRSALKWIMPGTEQGVLSRAVYLFVERRIGEVDVIFLRRTVLYQAQPLAEPLEVNYFTLAQELNNVVYIRVVAEP